MPSYASWIDTGWAGPRLAGSVIVIAPGKAWLIGMRYMELDEAALSLRLVYDGWIAVVGITLPASLWLS